MTFELPPLPYDAGELEPHMSARTIDVHYGKHHQKYVDKLNTLIEGTSFVDRTLEEIIRATWGNESKRTVFNNAAQVWNHTFFWDSMKPDGGGAPSDGELMRRIAAGFEDYEGFKQRFIDAATGRFGSGWAWLVQTPAGDLDVVSTLNAKSPLVDDQIPLLTCDVWEHAYYLDYQNRRADFVTTFLDKLVDWDRVAERMAAAS